MDQAQNDYKSINGFTDALLECPAIYLKRAIGDYHKNLQYIEREFQVRMLYDKRFITDECYPINVMTFLNLRGNKVNVIKAHKYLQNIISDLFVYRIYVANNDIRIIIANLMNVKKKIHPTEVRCCRDNA